MAWTDPNLVNWDVGDPVTSADMKTYVRDNLLALKDPPGDEYTLDEVSNYTTTSAVFVDVDGTNLSFTLDTKGGDVLVIFSGGSVLGNYVYFDVELDGSRIGDDDGLWRGGSGTVATFAIWVTDLAAGSHTFKLQWKKVGAGGATLYAGAGTSDYDLHPQFSVREVS